MRDYMHMDTVSRLGNSTTVGGIRRPMGYEFPSLGAKGGSYYIFTMRTGAFEISQEHTHPACVAHGDAGARGPSGEDARGKCRHGRSLADLSTPGIFREHAPADETHRTAKEVAPGTREMSATTNDRRSYNNDFAIQRDFLRIRVENLFLRKQSCYVFDDCYV